MNYIQVTDSFFKSSKAKAASQLDPFLFPNKRIDFDSDGGFALVAVLEESVSNKVMKDYLEQMRQDPVIYDKGLSSSFDHIIDSLDREIDDEDEKLNSLLERKPETFFKSPSYIWTFDNEGNQLDVFSGRLDKSPLTIFQ